MGSSRASTPAGRRRSARRGASAGHGRAAPKKRAPAKATAKRTAPKSRRASTKPKAKAPKRTAKPRRATRKRSATKRSRALRIVAVAGVVAGLLAVGYQLWFRSSSFVAVERVTVAGMTGPERGPAEAALTKAAKDMTTLDVDIGALRAAVAGLATVVDVEADADFPHGLAITVHERPPVLIAAAGGRTLPVAGDGTVLAGVDASGEDLPEIGVAELPAQGKLTGDALEIALVMGAAPKPLRRARRGRDVRGDRRGHGDASRRHARLLRRRRGRRRQVGRRRGRARRSEGRHPDLPRRARAPSGPPWAGPHRPSPRAPPRRRRPRPVTGAPVTRRRGTLKQ